MAKLRRPSQRSIDIYNQLVEQQNKVRKSLLKLHKEAEERLGVGRLPALVIPKRARKIRNIFNQGLSKVELRRRLQAFWRRYRQSKDLFSQGMSSYIKNTVMKGYKDLWINNQYGIGEAPNGAFGRYSKEQIEYSDKGDYMEVYNQLFTHGSDFFLALLYSNRIVEFKYIYADFKGDVERNYYVEQQLEMVRDVSNAKGRKQLFEVARYYKDDYKHSKKVLKNAKKLEEEDEE